MTLSDILSIGIALAFTYTVMSMLASIAKEAIAAKLEWRAKDLKQGITNMLNLDEPKPTPAVGAPGSTPPDLTSLFKHPLITAMSTAKSNIFASSSQPPNERFPSYIPARYFTLALLDVLSNGSQEPAFTAAEKTINALPSGDLKTRLLVFANEAGGDLDKLKTQFDSWFDDTMDRVSGAYKRRSQFVLLIIGAILALFLNVDTISIVGSLQKDAHLRNAVVSQASLFAADQKNSGPTASFSDLTSQLTDSGIAIGWTASDFALKQPGTWWMLLTFLTKFAGLMLTAAAISLGAPFWFDLLNQLVNLRSAGPKPPRADNPTSDTPGS